MGNHVPLPEEKDFVQKVAEALWAAGTSDNRDIAGGRSFVYRTLEEAFKDAVWHVYGLTTPQCEHVRDLLSEYGPDDVLRDTPGGTWGVESYVAFVRAHPRHPSYS